MKRNATIEGKTQARNHKTVLATAAKQRLEGGDLIAGLMETRRKYKVQVIVTGPEGDEVLNLTKLAFEGTLHNNGFAALDIQAALQTLIEAAGEWSA